MPSGEGRRSLQGSARAAEEFATSVVATLGCQKISEEEVQTSQVIPQPLEDEGFLKARAPCAARSVSSSLSVINWPFPLH